jgi:hypothetical protein
MVPNCDQVPVEADKADPTVNEPVITGKTELVTLDDGTTTVAAVFAVVLYAVDPDVKLPKTWARI